MYSLETFASRAVSDKYPVISSTCCGQKEGREGEGRGVAENRINSVLGGRKLLRPQATRLFLGPINSVAGGVVGEMWASGVCVDEWASEGEMMWSRNEPARWRRRAVQLN